MKLAAVITLLIPLALSNPVAIDLKERDTAWCAVGANPQNCYGLPREDSQIIWPANPGDFFFPYCQVQSSPGWLKGDTLLGTCFMWYGWMSDPVKCLGKFFEITAIWRRDANFVVQLTSVELIVELGDF
jgi:hypothetical protein